MGRMPFLSSSKRRQNTEEKEEEEEERGRGRGRRRRRTTTRRKMLVRFLARQTGGRPGKLMFYRCYLLSFSSSFLTIAWSKEISEPTRPTFTKFPGLVDMWLQMFNLASVSRSLKGRCHDKQF